jgi:galactoside O-acetyltransferase
MPGNTGIILRRKYYKNKFKSCGKNLVIDVGVSISGTELISVGDDVFIDKYCIISTGKNLIGEIHRKKNESFLNEEGEIHIGNNIHIAQFCILMGYGGLVIENNCVLSADCKIYTLTNTAYNPTNRSEIVSLMPYNQSHFLLSPIILKRNVWLGLNSIIMPGITVGENSFIVSNSLLLSSFPNNSYINGQPAEKIKNRFNI